MELGFVGLGRMGFNMVQRLVEHGHNVVAYNRTQDKVTEIVEKGAKGAKSVQDLEPIFKTLAPENGYLHCGPSGSGHFVKMVHNGIEYGMLQAFGEGYEIMEKSRYKLDLYAISKMWQNGSVVRSWLLDLAVL